MTASVVIPTYKASAFIAETLASVFAQTRLPDEVIIVDDCSPDDTLAVVEMVACSAPMPVRSIRLDANSGGPARPLNVGIRAATGDIISLLDHDDLMFPDKIATHAQLLADCPTVGLVFGDVEVVQNGRVYSTPRVSRDLLIQRLLNGSKRLGSDSFEISSHDAYNSLVWFTSIAMTCSNLTIRKSAWESAGGFDERYRSVCDWQLFHSICYVYPVAYIHRLTAQWYASSINLTQSSTSTGLRDEEVYQVWNEMDAYKLASDNKRLLRSHLVADSLAIAWACRNRGNYRHAARLYVESLKHQRLNREALFGLAKLIPYMIASTLKKYT